MVVNINDISDMMFKHIENKHLYPIEKLKLLIEKRKLFVLENESVKNAQIQHIVEYMNTKAINNEIYNQFIIDRSELVKKWKAEKSKDSLRELVKMQYIDPCIHDIFSNIKHLSDHSSVHKEELRPNKKQRVNKDKNAQKSEPWFLKNVEKTFQSNMKFWDKKKSVIVKSPHYLQPFDLEDVHAVENSLLTSATINIFMTSILQSSDKTSKYIVFPSEFYYMIKDIIDNTEEIKTIMKNEMFVNIGDDWMNKIIIIPTNLNNIHWILCIINPYEGNIYVIDPYDTKQTAVFDTISKWRSIFLENYPQVSNKQFQPVYTIPNIPTQNKKDIDNCGVFISMYTMYLINTNEFPSIQNFNTNDIPMIRKYMLNTITQYTKYNEVKS